MAARVNPKVEQKMSKNDQFKADEKAKMQAKLNALNAKVELL